MKMDGGKESRKTLAKHWAKKKEEKGSKREQKEKKDQRKEKKLERWTSS